MSEFMPDPGEILKNLEQVQRFLEGTGSSRVPRVPPGAVEWRAFADLQDRVHVLEGLVVDLLAMHTTEGIDPQPHPTTD